MSALQRALAALQTLVALKDLKDEITRRKRRRLYRFKGPGDAQRQERFEVDLLDADYKRRKPLAWAEARAAIAAATGAEP